MSSRLLRIVVVGLEVAIVDSLLERRQRRVTMSYPRLRKLRAETRLVSGDGELKDVVRGRSDPTFRNEEVVGEKEGEDRRELYMLAI